MIYEKELKKPEIVLSGCFLAGGSILSAITSKPISDYDFYIKNRKNLFNVLEEILDKNMLLINKSDRAYTFKCNDIMDIDGNRKLVQLIIIDDYKDVETIFNSFDFTVCMAAYDCDAETYHYHSSFKSDVMSRRINFNTDTKYPYASLVRLKKYSEKGFFVPKSEYLKVGMSIARAGLPSSWEELSGAIGGIYGKELVLGENLEFNFDNIIEQLSNVVIPDPREVEEDLSKHKILDKIFKLKFQFSEDCFRVYEKINANEKIETVKYGSTEFVILDNKKTNLVMTSETHYPHSIGSVDSSKKKVYNINHIFGKIETDAIDNETIQAYVVSFIKDSEMLGLGCKVKPYLKNDFNCSTISYGKTSQPTVLLFTEIGDAMEFAKSYLKSISEKDINFNYYKVVVQSKDICSYYNKEIFFANTMVVKGL